MPTAPYYRYVSAGERTVIQAATPWLVPNVDRSGKSKLVYFTRDYYTSVTQTEAALQIGAQDPTGLQPSPTDRLNLDVTGITFTDLGTVPGGTGSQLTTWDRLLVTAVSPLTLP